MNDRADAVAVVIPAPVGGSPGVATPNFPKENAF